MGVNRSFIQLLRSGMGKNKSRDELEDERHLVVQSRVWFYVRLQSRAELTAAVPRRAPVGGLSLLSLMAECLMEWVALPSCGKTSRFTIAGDCSSIRSRSLQTPDSSLLSN